DSPRLSAQIDPRLSPETEQADVFKQGVLPQALAQVDKTGVAGIFDHFQISLAPVSPAPPTAQARSAHLRISRIEKMLLQIHLVFLQSGRQGDDLEGGAGFVGFPDGQVPVIDPRIGFLIAVGPERSEEHTLNSSHVKISYDVFCLKKKT